MNNETMSLAAALAVCQEAFDLMSGAPCNEDDCAMLTDASADDLRAWVDDLEARVGYDVENFRAAIECMIQARNTRPAFAVESLPANMRDTLAAAAARKWVWVSPKGAAFWMNEDTAHREHAQHGGFLFPPEA